MFIIRARFRVERRVAGGDGSKGDVEREREKELQDASCLRNQAAFVGDDREARVWIIASAYVDDDRGLDAENVTTTTTKKGEADDVLLSIREPKVMKNRESREAQPSSHQCFLTRAMLEGCFRKWRSPDAPPRRRWA